MENGRVSVGLPPQIARAVAPAPAPAQLVGYEKLVVGQTKTFAGSDGHFEQAIAVLSSNAEEREKTCKLVGKFASTNSDVRVTLHLAAAASSDEANALVKAIKSGAGKRAVAVEVVGNNPAAHALLVWVRDTKAVSEPTLAHVLVAKKLQLPE
ncbi:hypothetical protein OPU71_10140 [Niveibacterium sp. 24ML]|uniref:hypothetical protein n=1 Tax=Niveibacterium sp. 24ML TaxID=2985512 RepID=UPI00226F839C|nr:hypothetical protein [Niveibacterium sp. 24ML]MCX9156480.1 hypothetical protein [Niveibacterium sp. 24ML]